MGEKYIQGTPKDTVAFTVAYKLQRVRRICDYASQRKPTLSVLLYFCIGSKVPCPCPSVCCAFARLGNARAKREG